MQRFWDQVTLLVGTGLGIGRIPFAPGTFGTLWGLPLVWGLRQLPAPLQYLAIALLFLIGVLICGRSAKLLGRDDPGAVVYDEIVAMPVVFLAVSLSWWTAVAGFIWFRVFDISKPWPASRLERLHGGLGIMIDDAVAGVYAGVALWATAKLAGWDTLI